MGFARKHLRRIGLHPSSRATSSLTVAKMLKAVNKKKRIWGSVKIRILSPVGPGAQSFMKALLAAHGDELLAFLAEHCITGSDKPVIVLPSNGRELQ
jgi:hypothetical protein